MNGNRQVGRGTFLESGTKQEAQRAKNRSTACWDTGQILSMARIMTGRL